MKKEDEKGRLGKIILLVLALVIFSALVYASTWITSSHADFDEGTYYQTFYNTNGFVQLNATTSGNYTSKVFDAGATAQWNNLTWQGNLPEKNNSIITLPKIAYVLSEQYPTETKLTPTDIAIINESDEKWFKVQVSKQTGEAYLRINWKNNISSGARINLLNITLEHKESNIPEINFIKGQVEINGEFIDVCNFGFSDSDITEFCNLLPYVNTSESVNDFNFKILINGTADKAPHTEIDYVKLDIGYASTSTNLSFQVRNCSLANCSGADFIDTNLDNMNLTGRYFQYRANFFTENASYSPELYNVTVDYTPNNLPDTTLIILNSTSVNNYATDNLTCYATIEDADSDNLIAYYKWYKNSALAFDGNISVSNGTLTLISTIKSVYTSVGDVWTCSILAYDGIDKETEWNNAIIIIQSKEAPSPPSGGGGGGRKIPPTPLKCTENWQCTGWFTCMGGEQTRKCTDINNCNTIINAPSLWRECELAEKEEKVEEEQEEEEKEEGKKGGGITTHILPMSNTFGFNFEKFKENMPIISLVLLTIISLVIIAYIKKIINFKSSISKITRIKKKLPLSKS